MKTLDEVIEALNNCADVNANFEACECCEYRDIRDDGYDCGRLQMMEDALHYLRELRQNLAELGNPDGDHQQLLKCQALLQELYRNEPLSWDELKQMEGKPVWVEEKYSFNNEWHGGWEVINTVWDSDWDDDPYLSMTNEEYRHKDDMGERWQAYRKERTE